MYGIKGWVVGPEQGECRREGRGTPATESAEGERGSVSDPGQDSAPLPARSAGFAPGSRGPALTHPETEHLGSAPSRYGLEQSGIRYPRRVRWNLSTAALTREAVFRGEAILAHGGPIVVHTGEFTGRSPLDRYVVGRPETDPDVLVGSPQPAVPAGAVRASALAVHRLSPEPGALRSGLPRRRPSPIPSAPPGDHHHGVAEPLFHATCSCEPGSGRPSRGTSPGSR